MQHGEAFVGHERANRMPGVVERIPNLFRDPRERARVWRMHYFGDACRLMQFTAMLQLRCGDRLRPGARRALERFDRADRSRLPLARLAALGARELLGQRRETLGGEWLLLHAFGWRHLIDANARDVPQKLVRLDAVPPAPRDPTPEARTEGAAVVRALDDKIAPLRLDVRADAPPRVNLLVPTIDLDHFFGGYIGKFNLARRLAERGARVRVVTVDPTAPLPAGWRDALQGYDGLGGRAGPRGAGVRARGGHAGGEPAGRVDRDDVVDGPRRARRGAGDRSRALPLPRAGARDLHVPDGEPRRARRRLLRPPARRASTPPNCCAATTGSAASASSPPARRRAMPRSTSFDNAITAVEPPPADVLRARRPRRLLFYARPEPHAARNMFELGALALRRAAAAGAFAGGWTLHGIGTTGGAHEVDLGGGSRSPCARAPRRPATRTCCASTTPGWR